MNKLSSLLMAAICGVALSLGCTQSGPRHASEAESKAAMAETMAIDTMGQAMNDDGGGMGSAAAVNRP